MEAFALLKFWKSNIAKVAGGGSGDTDGAETVVDSTFSDPLEDSDRDDDSFFELELTLPNYDSKFPKPNPCSKNLDQERETEPKPSSKPQSPISILRSAPPRLRVFMFGKFKKRKPEEFETESVSSNFSPKRSDSSLFTVKFKIEDGSIVPKFTRSNSSSLSSPKSSDECYESSKRFSKDVVQKYLNRIKPLYAKSLKKYGETEKFAASPTRSTESFPTPSRFKAKRKQLGKSKSASAVIGDPSPVTLPVRSDHPHDGIEGAILHCKRSLNSSKGHSSLSRCSSDPSHEKSIQVSE